MDLFTFIKLFFIFMLVLTGFGLLFAIGLYTYHKGRRSTEENADKAIIFIKNGKHIGKPVKAEKLHRTAKATAYHFNHHKNIVIVPAKYTEVFYKERRLIHLDNKGKLIASAFGNDEEPTKDEKSDLIKEFVFTESAKVAISKIKQPSKVAFSFVVIIIAFFVGVAITFGIVQFQKNFSYQSQQQQQQQQQQIPNQKIIPAK